jgi:CBS domain-containing protein
MNGDAPEDRPAAAKIRDNGTTSPADRERIERFESAYNRIDRELQRLLDEPREGRRRGFAANVRQISAERRHFGRHLDFLLEAGELRNALIHNRFGATEYIAVPTLATVEKLEAIDAELHKPVPLRALAAREVVTIDAGERLARLLDLVRTRGVVRFPVRRDGKITALLTASGVVRWIASHDLGVCGLPGSPAPAEGPLHAAGGPIICAIADVSLAEVLARDHRRDEFAILPEGASADAALSLWSRNPRLEAIIITAHGRADETPIGIATATDLLKLLQPT